jgi:hypothetical protein
MTFSIRLQSSVAPVLLVLGAAALVGCEQSQDLSGGPNTGPEGGAASEAGPDSGVVPEGGAGTGTDAGPGTSEAGVQDSGGGSQRLVLFGGSSPTSLLGDTWTWDGTSWTQETVTGPSARANAIGGSVHGQVTLFGGTDDGDGAETDTWTWNGSTWTQQMVTGPAAAATGLDTYYYASTVGQNLVVLVGDDSEDDFTWLWNGTAWTQEPQGAGPVNLIGYAATTFQDKMMLFGNGAIWGNSGGNWAKIPLAAGGPDNTSPSAAPVVATLGGKVVLFNGEADSFGMVSETWTWDGTNWTLQNVKGPSPRSYASMAAVNGTVVLFGGCVFGFSGTQATCLDDTWTWDGAHWTQQNVQGPSARDSALLVAE